MLLTNDNGFFMEVECEVNSVYLRRNGCKIHSTKGALADFLSTSREAIEKGMVTITYLQDLGMYQEYNAMSECWVDIDLDLNEHIEDYVCQWER